MLGFTTRLAQHVLGRLRSGFHSGSPARIHAQAVLAGAALGAVVRGLAASADQTGEPAFRLAMALIVVAAGSSAFVLYALHGQATHASNHATTRNAQARVCIGLLAGGIITSIHALQHLLA